jgi:hypothetical protein
MRRGKLGIAAVAALAMAAMGATAGQASAATITPDIAFDEFTLDNGDCSLREAVISANDNTDIGGCTSGVQVQGAYGTDTIEIEATNYILTLAGVEDAGLTGDLDVEGQLTVRGPDDATAVVTTNLSDRLFHLQTATTRLTVDDATLTDGESGGSGGIISATTDGNDVVLTDAVIDGGEALIGGGVRVDGTGSSLVSTDSIFEDNLANTYGGAASIGPNAAATFTRTAFFTNDATATTGGGQGGGGALHIQTGGSQVTITDSDFQANEASATDPTADWALGGAIYSTRDLRIEGTLFAGNSADTNGPADSLEYGGALHVGNPGDTVVNNSTFFSNDAGNANVAGEDARGGAIYKSGGGLDVSFSTFNQNGSTNAAFADSIDNGNSGSETTFSASVFPSGSNTCEGNNVSSEGFNVASADADCNFVGSDDVAGIPSGIILGNPLDNGGPTLTFGLQAASRAIDQVPFASCADAGGFDARNYPRSGPGVGAACDAGAYERTVCNGVVQNGDFTPCPVIPPVDGGTQPGGTPVTPVTPATPAPKCKKAKKKKKGKKGKKKARCGKKKKGKKKKKR